MFDVGFSEIILICIVALIVLGPDKLPGTIRVLGLWIGRLKRSFNNIKTEIEKEVGADEIRRQLRNEEIMDKIKKTKSDFNNTVQSVKKEATSVTDSIKPEGLDELKKDFDSVTGKSTPEKKSAPADADKSQADTDTATPEQPPGPKTEPAGEQPAPSGSETESKKPGSDKSES